MVATRHWTESEDALLKKLWMTDDRAVVARAVGRSVGAIAGRAQRLGLPVSPPMPKDIDERLRECFAAGMTDAEASRCLRVCRTTVRKRRRRMGLPQPYDNRSWSPARRKATEEARKKIAAEHDCNSWSEYLTERRRLKYAYEFPGCRTRHEVIVCKALVAMGRATPAQMRERTGISLIASRRILRRLALNGVLLRSWQGHQRVYTLKRKSPQVEEYQA